MIYELMQRIIGRGGFDAEDVLNKLDIYLVFGRLSREEYAQLAAAAGADPDAAKE